MEQDGGMSFAEYARLYHQDASLAAQTRQLTTRLELRINAIQQAQHDIANLERERERLIKLTTQIEGGGSDLSSSSATFVRRLHRCLGQFEANWEASMQKLQSSSEGRKEGQMDWTIHLRDKRKVLDMLQESLGDYHLLAKAIVSRPESLALVLALVHASQGEYAVLALSEEIALLATGSSETLLLTLLDTLQGHGSYITESDISDNIVTYDPLSPSHLVELELLDYLQSGPSRRLPHATIHKHTPSHRNFSTPNTRTRKVSTTATTISATLSSMSSSAAQLWNTATTLPHQVLEAANSPPETPDVSYDPSVDLSSGTQATASFTHESRHAKDVLCSIAASSPRKRTVSMGSKSEIRVVSPTKPLSTSGEQQSPRIKRAASRLLGILADKERCKTARRFPIAIALCRRLLLHHFPSTTHPTAHKRLSVLLIVRWFAFSRLSSLISRPNSVGRSLAGHEHSWAFGSLQFGQGSTFAKANMDNAKSRRESQCSGIMQGVSKRSGDISLGELHRCLYSKITQAVEGDCNEATDLVSTFGVGSHTSPTIIARPIHQTLTSTLSLRYRDAKQLWELLGKGDLDEELKGKEPVDGDTLGILYATTGWKGDGIFGLFSSLESVEEYLSSQQEDSRTTTSTLSILPRSFASSSGWGSPPSSPFHQAMNRESGYFGEKVSTRADPCTEDDNVVRGGIDALIGKGYAPSVMDTNETSLVNVLEDARLKAKECFAFDDSIMFASSLARLPREGFKTRRMLQRLALNRLEKVESKKSKLERLNDYLEGVEQHRIVLIDRARLVYERLQELRVRVWYATEVRVSAVVRQSREAAQRGLDDVDESKDCTEWMQSSGIYNFEADKKLTRYLQELDPAFQKIASDAKSFFQSPIWRREWTIARPFLEGSCDDGKPATVAILTFGVCSLAMLKPDDHRSSALVSLEDFLQRIQLLCTGLFLSEALQGIDLGSDDVLVKRSKDQTYNQDLVAVLKADGAVELLQRFQLHPSPRVKMQSILTLERLIIARLERPEMERRSQPSQTSIPSQDDTMSIASYRKPRRALSMYEDEAIPLNLHDALLSQEKGVGEEGQRSRQDDSDAATIIAPWHDRIVVAPTTDDVVTVLEALLRDEEVRPKNLFAILQIIAAFSPLQVLDLKDEGKAFWDLALASLSLRKEAAQMDN